jgi:acyl-CoA thioesterase I
MQLRFCSVILKLQSFLTASKTESVMGRRIVFWEILIVMTIGGGCTSTKNSTAIKSDDTLANYRNSQDQDGRPIIVAFGDSLTAGAGVAPELNYPTKLQKKIDQFGYRYAVVNAGISGETSSQGLARLRSVCNLHPAIVIVEFGANDGLRGFSLDEMERNLIAIVGGIHASGSKTVLAGMKVPPHYGLSYANSFSRIFKTVADTQDSAFIPFFLEGVGGQPDLNQEDGIHPTAKGYDIIAETVWKVIEPML